MAQKRMKTWKTVLIVAAVVLAAGFIGMFAFMSSVISRNDSLPRGEVDLTQVEDGFYDGSAGNGLVSVDVNVTVADHKLTAIEITRHFEGQGEGAEVIVDDMIEQNSTDVDSISGATMSSEVIKSAVYDALTNP